MSRSPIRLAVVGGRRGAAFDGGLESLAQRITLRAVCDLDEGTLAAWRERHPEITTYTSYERLLGESDCDAVFLATPLTLHAAQAIQALRAGRHVLSEVIAATTVEECWALVEAVEGTGLTYMMAENCCYMRPNATVRAMVEAGVFGETVYAEGAYIHDCRNLIVDARGELTWRGEMRRRWNGNHYPTHSLGPVAQWLGINRTDRLASTATWKTPARAAREYVAERFGADHPAAQPGFFTAGDSATTVISTAKGHVIVLRVDSTSPRPHNMTHYVLQGTKAAYLSGRHAGEEPLVWIDGRSPGVSPGDAAWEPLSAYAEEYEGPAWRRWGEAARRAGHSGGDFFVIEEFASAIESGERPAIDVYDAVTWSSIMPLSLESVARGGTPVEVPDFRKSARALQ